MNKINNNRATKDRLTGTVHVGFCSRTSRIYKQNRQSQHSSN